MRPVSNIGKFVGRAYDLNQYKCCILSTYLVTYLMYVL